MQHKKERSRLHHMALHYSDNLARLVEWNEKAWDARFGTYISKVLKVPQSTKLHIY